MSRQRGAILFGALLFLAVLGVISLARPACSCGEVPPPDPIVDQIRPAPAT